MTSCEGLGIREGTDGILPNSTRPRSKGPALERGFYPRARWPITLRSVLSSVLSSWDPPLRQILVQTLYNKLTKHPLVPPWRLEPSNSPSPQLCSSAKILMSYDAA